MTVKTRITLFIVGAGIISSLLFSVVVFYELLEQPFELLDTVLREEAYRTTLMIAKEEGKSGSGPVDSSSQVWDSWDSYWIEIYDRSTDKILFRSSLAKSVKLPLLRPGSRKIVHTTLPQDQIKPAQESSREITFRTRTFSIDLQGRSFIVQIARPMQKLNEEIWELAVGIFGGLIFSTIVLIAMSRFVAGKILQPIGQLKNLAQDISDKNLDQRIPDGGGRDEFSELARTINQMLDRLQYSFARQRDFLFDTSHELKTPISTIRLAVDEICALDRDDLPSFVADNLHRLNNQVLRMERLIKDLLKLSSLETLNSIEPKPVDMCRLLTSLAAEYQFLAEPRNIKIDNSLPNQLLIHGDVEKLTRAFSNILDNAVKYNVDGGRIEMTGCQSAEELTIVVTNTGPGVAEVEIPKLFDQFYRAEKSRSLQHGGSGLGLTIVRRIVELHGGRVKIANRQEGWTEVMVTLPLRRDTISI